MRPMRRSAQSLSREESERILSKATSGTLALSGDTFPYAVPLSYVHDHGRIYFHCAPEGEKLDRIRKDPHASFCVIAEDTVVPEKFTTVYQSVILNGLIRIVTDRDEKQKALELLAGKYSPQISSRLRDQEISSQFERVCVLALDIENVSGKEGIERVRRKCQTRAQS